MGTLRSDVIYVSSGVVKILWRFCEYFWGVRCELDGGKRVSASQVQLLLGLSWRQSHLCFTKAFQTVCGHYFWCLGRASSFCVVAPCLCFNFGNHFGLFLPLCFLW